VCNLSGDQIVQAPPPKACSSRSSSSGITRALLVVEVTQEVAAELEMGVVEARERGAEATTAPTWCASPIPAGSSSG
jgi:hypothetical protein